MFHSFRTRTIAIGLTVLITSCQTGTDDLLTSQQAKNSAAIFSDSVTNFEVHVFYETGAEPYTGLIGLTANETWDITKNSYESLFDDHTPRTVSVPTNLAEMAEIADQNKNSWSADDLIQLAREYAPSLMNSPTANVTVIFLNGTYNGSSNILGVQLTGYPFAFVFKDVVVSVGGDSVSQKYVEQATVVHELGHVVGLVNHGVPLVTNHEDSSHPSHTSNTSCVMHWKVTSTNDILNSLASFIFNDRLNLFGTESLQDGRSYHP